MPTPSTGRSSDAALDPARSAGVDPSGTLSAACTVVFRTGLALTCDDRSGSAYGLQLPPRMPAVTPGSYFRPLVLPFPSRYYAALVGCVSDDDFWFGVDGSHSTGQ